ncbi:MAG: hypothetical protein CME32_31765 [Gimesia sp.]|uniref:DUF1573 domain-containing protein n=1 Tax=Gimesia benthica TaxID=2608982 RepID=A0A6I6AGS9_9PLAN|nr:DUF1573 domain-containing protein [Gimesia benthica]MBN73856.1 hypothetical protein [Gimesia sp.]QGQ25843.1 DUF1573 domain-containing protein [Gimesia benthica]
MLQKINSKNSIYSLLLALISKGINFYYCVLALVIFFLSSLVYYFTTSEPIAQEIRRSANHVASFKGNLTIQNVVDLGRIPPESKSVGRFSVKNENDFPVRIKNISASCGCTVVESYDPIVPAGSEIFIQFTLGTSRANPYSISKNIAVITEGFSSDVQLKSQVQVIATVDKSLGIDIVPRIVRVNPKVNDTLKITVTGAKTLVSEFPNELNLANEDSLTFNLPNIISSGQVVSKDCKLVGCIDRNRFIRSKSLNVKWAFKGKQCDLTIPIVIENSNNIRINPGIIRLPDSNFNKGASFTLNSIDGSDIRVVDVTPLGRQDWNSTYDIDSSTVKVTLSKNGCVQLKSNHKHLLKLTLKTEGGEELILKLPILHGSIRK